MVQCNDDLFAAMHRDDVKAFGSLLLARNWTSYSKWFDYHLLSMAIQFGRKKVANHLLDLQCRVTKPGELNTFVHFVAQKYSGWAELIVKLIKLGAPVSTVNAQGDTAVHVAFKNDADGDLIDLLLETYVRETTRNSKDSDGLSILHIVCSRPNLKIVQALMYRGRQVIVTRKDFDGQVQSNYDTGYSGYTPLHFAVKNGQTAIVRYLLQHFNVDTYKVEANSSTPLHLALERGDITMMDCLLAHDKVHMDRVNNMGFSHFMAACAASNSSIVAEYIRLSQYRAQTPFSSLVSNKVADFSGSPYGGFSALHFAAEFGRLDTVQLLLKHGASCFVVSAENLTPLVVALRRGHENICRLLFHEYKVYRQKLFDDVRENDRKLVAVEKSNPVEVKKQTLPPPPGFGGYRTSSPPPSGFYIQQNFKSPLYFGQRSSASCTVQARRKRIESKIYLLGCSRG